MIQEMEAWILSQIDKIEEFGKNEGLIRKREDEVISNNALIKNKHPEQINKPSYHGFHPWLFIFNPYVVKPNLTNHIRKQIRLGNVIISLVIVVLQLPYKD